MTDGQGDKFHIHHISANHASHLNRKDGPGMVMDSDDHLNTAGWGQSKDACAYRNRQKDLIQNG